MITSDAVCRVARVGLPARLRAVSAVWGRPTSIACESVDAFSASGLPALVSCQERPEVGRVYQQMLYNAGREYRCANDSNADARDPLTSCTPVLDRPQLLSRLSIGIGSGPLIGIQKGPHFPAF